MSENGTFSLTLERVKKYEFQAKFDWHHLEPIILDEPAPLGNNKGANAARLLGASVANCLSASLPFCLEKSRMEVKGIKTDVKDFLERNERGRWRVVRLDVYIALDVPNEKPQRISR